MPSPDVATLSSADLAGDKQAPVEQLEAGAEKTPGGEDGERLRIQLTGRIGYKPRFRETPNGIRVGSFALAVHEEPGQTRWHSIVTFGDRARKIEEAGFGKEDEVTVVGYPHERERRNPKTGDTRMITEIYAAVVKKASENKKA